ncbi:EpsG family protein [Phocaeicola sp.]
MIFAILWCCLYVIIGTYAYYTDDYNQYVDIVENAYVNPLKLTHIEPLWFFFMESFKGNIDAFRLYSFSVLILLLFFIALSARINVCYFFLYYTLLCAPSHFCWIRQPISMCFFLFGMLLLCKKRLLIGLLFVFLSYFLHKSTVLLVVLLPFVFYPFNKKSVFISLLMFPLAFLLFALFLNYEIIPGLNIQYYFEQENEYSERNILFSIFSFFATLLQFYLIGYTLVLLYKREEYEFRLLTRFLFGVFYLSFFFFIYPIDNNTIYKRLLAFGIFLSALFLTKYIGRDLFKKKNIWLLISLLILIFIREAIVIGKNYTDIELLLKM